jgi:hypothetical protein
MMFKSFLIIIILASVASCTEKRKAPDCSTVKTGKFEYRGVGKEVIKIDRNDSMQFEKDENTGLFMKFKVEWKTPCTYKLKAATFLLNGRDSVIDPSELPDMETEILQVTKNYYICQTIENGQRILYKDTMLIIK